MVMMKRENYINILMVDVHLTLSYFQRQMMFFGSYNKKFTKAVLYIPTGKTLKRNFLLWYENNRFSGQTSQVSDLNNSY